MEGIATAMLRAACILEIDDMVFAKRQDCIGKLNWFFTNPDEMMKECHPDVFAAMVAGIKSKDRETAMQVWVTIRDDILIRNLRGIVETNGTWRTDTDRVKDIDAGMKLYLALQRRGAMPNTTPPKVLALQVLKVYKFTVQPYFNVEKIL